MLKNILQSTGMPLVCTVVKNWCQGCKLICWNLAVFYVGVFVLQSCEVMAAASVSRPGSAQTTEKSQLILKGNRIIFPLFNEL